MKDMTQTVFVLGVMAGAMVFTTLSDNCGRKPVFMAVNWSLVIIGILQVFINDYYVFTFFRFLTGSLQQVGRSFLLRFESRKVGIIQNNTFCFTFARSGMIHNIGISM
jgi:MFS family permease